MKKIAFYLSLFTAVAAGFACHKNNKADPHVPPNVELKTGSGYTFQSETVGKKDTITIGLVANKTEDDLKSYNASVRYDAATASSTFFNYILTSAENVRYEKDLQIITRDTSGIEHWIFSIVDRDGNITQKTIDLTVQ